MIDKLMKLAENSYSPYSKFKVGAAILLNNGNIIDVYGGGNAASVLGSTSLDINGGIISNNVYGGGNEAEVTGNTLLDVDNASIPTNLYGGGNQGAGQGLLFPALHRRGTGDVGHQHCHLCKPHAAFICFC